MKYYEDPILGKGRATDVSGGTGGGTEYVGGFGISLGGDTISLARYRNIETVSGNTVTLMAGHAYKAYATSTAITLNTETIPANQFGLEGHIEIFVSGTGYVVTGTNVVLSEPLEPDSVNNITARFHDGLCILSVEDHVAGYIVVSATGLTAGTLPYALSTATQEYVAFDASLNGSSLDMGGAVTNGEKHVVGNGYSETILTGGVSCTSKTTFANLAMSAASVTGGTMTLGDVYIPQGGTVTVSGGGLAIEKVNGNGGVIDLGGTDVGTINSGKTAIFDGVIITSGLSSGTNVAGGVFTASGTVVANSCTFANCSATYGGAVAQIKSGSHVTLNNCIVSGNNTSYGTFFATGGELVINGGTYTGNITSNGGGCALITNGTVSVANAIISGNKASAGATSYVTDFRMNTSGGNLYLEGGCTVGSIQGSAGTVTFRGLNNVTSVYGGVSVVISSGAALDLTGNTNATPINPGGITVLDGGCQVITSAGSTVSIAGGTYTQINNDGTTE